VKKLLLSSIVSLMVSFPLVRATARVPADPSSNSFKQGLSDRSSWETLFSSLRGLERDGALYWASERSKTSVIPCLQNISKGDKWIYGCSEAQSRLALSDFKRKTDPQYWYGWNSYSAVASVLPTSSTISGKGTAFVNPFQNTSSQAASNNQTAESATGGQTLVPVLAPPADATVSVTGYGSSPYEARNDAIRVALQETMKQLIVVDRSIEGDTITRNKIMSTMNGYVQSFDQISLKFTNGSYALAANVTVSPSRIENYLGVDSTGGTSINGESVSADINREQEQQKAEIEIFAHLLRGYPTDAMEVTVTGISPNPTDTSTFILSAKLEVSKTFFHSVTQGIAALAANQVPISGRQINTRPQNDLGLEYGSFANAAFQVNTVCVDGGSNVLEPGSGTCFELPAANYLSQMFLPQSFSFAGLTVFPVLEFALRFLDKNGNSVDGDVIGADCFVVPGYVNNELNQFQKPMLAYLPTDFGLFNSQSSNENHLGLSIYDYPLDINFVLPISSVNLEHVSEVAAVAALPIDTNNSLNYTYDIDTLSPNLQDTPPSLFAMDLVSPPVTKDKVCGEPLDEAAARVMISRQ
jgi:hypothetical protein